MGILQEACLIAIVAFAEPAFAHDQYPRDCCSGQDCRPALAGEIELTREGLYHVVPTGELFTRSQVRPSFDANFHRCLYDPSNPRSRTLCVFVPAGT